MLDPHVYEADTEVRDPEPMPVMPVRPRTVTDGALTMQVYKQGTWHRRTPDLATTACGVAIHSEFDPVRREELCEPLCRECFTAYEQTIARDRARAELLAVTLEPEGDTDE